MKKRVVIPLLLAAFAAILGVLAFKRYSDSATELRLPPAICFPEPTNSAVQALDGQFMLFTHIEEIPENIRPAFREQNGGQWAIADPGKKFEATDFITNDSLPRRRLVFGGRSNEATFVYYEQGGLGLSLVLDVFRTAAPNVQPLWRRYCPRRTNTFDDLKTMVSSGQCATSAERHQGNPCEDRPH